jgi:hypothetical protein
MNRASLPFLLRPFYFFLLCVSLVQPSWADALDHWTVRNPKAFGSLNAVTYGDGLFVAVGDTGAILTSPDAATWTVRYTNAALNLKGVAYGNGKFVAGGYYGQVLTSPDGLTWTIAVTNSQAFSKVRFAAGVFLATTSGGNHLGVSTNGVQWNFYTVNPGIYDVAYANGIFVGGSAAGVVTSTNLTSWTFRPVGFSSMNAVAYGLNRFVAVGTGSFAVSSNGVDWLRSGAPNDNYAALTFGNGAFLALTFNGDHAYSRDATNWTAVDANSPVYSSTFGNGLFVAVGYQGSIQTATDPAGPWVERGTITSEPFYGVAYGANSFVAVGSQGLIATSGDGSNWVLRLARNTNYLSLWGVTFGAGRFVAVGDNGLIMASVDTTNWTSLFVSRDAYLQRVTYGNGLYLAVGILYDSVTGLPLPVIYTSADAEHWSQTFAPGSQGLTDVAYGNGRFVALAANPNLDGWTSLASTDGVNWVCGTPSGVGSITRLTFANNTFVGVGTTGGVGVSPDGLQWFVTSVGPGWNLQGVTYGQGAFVAVGDGSSVFSAASGLNWTNRFLDYFSGRSLSAVTFGNGTFVALGTGGLILQSDPYTPAATGLPVIQQQPVSVSATPGGSASFAVGAEGGAPLRFQWRKGNTSVPGATNSVLFLSNLQPSDAAAYSVAVSNLQGGLISEPAFLTLLTLNPADYWHLRSWPGSSVSSSDFLQAVAYGNNNFVAVGSPNLIVSSTNGAAWFRHVPPVPFQGRDIVFGNDIFLALGVSEEGSDCTQLLSSRNGITWTNLLGPTSSPISCPSPIRALAYGAGLFIAGGDDSILVSSNGSTWSAVVTGADLGLKSIAYGNGMFVAVGTEQFSGQNLILFSFDGVAWNYGSYDPSADGFGLPFRKVAFGGGLFVVTGPAYVMFSSADGIFWDTDPLSGSASAIGYGNGRFLAAGNPDQGFGSELYASGDGTGWSPHYWGDPAFYYYIQGLAYGQNTFVAVGAPGLILQSDPFTNMVPSLLQQPRSRILVANGFSAATLDVLAIGSSPLVYEWYRNGLLLCSTNSPALLLSPVRFSDAGDYQVRIHNPYGAVTSAVARVTVEPATPVVSMTLDPSPRLLIYGKIGTLYSIQSLDSLADPGLNVWRTLAIVTLPSIPYAWIDPESENVPQRFYRVVEGGSLH